MLIDIAIGLVFVYVLFSLVVTAAQEIFAALTDRRSRFLQDGIGELLHDRSLQGMARRLFDHPLIAGLSRKADGRPSYIPTPFFVSALVDAIGGSDGTGATLSLEALRAKINSLETDLDVPAGAATRTGELKKTLLLLLNEAGQGTDALVRFRANIQKWYDDSMERVSGWYRANVQIVLFIISLSLAVLCNVDSLYIIEALAADPKLRGDLASQAVDYVNQQHDVERAKTMASASPKDAADKALEAASADPKVRVQKLKDATAALTVTRLPMGWGDNARSQFFRKTELAPGREKNGQTTSTGKKFYDEFLFTHLLTAMLGWLLTALAGAIGAPFWFDQLGKFVTLRASGRSPDERDPISRRTQDPPPPPAGGIGDTSGLTPRVER